MRFLARPEVVFITGLIGVTLAARHMTRYSEGSIHLLATGLLSVLITEPTVSARRSHARIRDGATR